MTKLNTMLCGAALMALVAGVSAPALAGEGTVKQAGDFLLRGRVAAVIPSEDASVETIGGDVKIDDSVIPELDLTYFFTNNIGVEVIAGVTPHDVRLRNSTAGDVDLGSVWLLPPTVTLQYHFDPIGQYQISPYLGAGVNWTHFFGADTHNPVTNMDYSNSFGGALQAGVDVPVAPNWFLNLDVKKVWINSDVDVTVSGLGTVRADVDIDPWIVGVGVGYKF